MQQKPRLIRAELPDIDFGKLGAIVDNHLGVGEPLSVRRKRRLHEITAVDARDDVSIEDGPIGHWLCAAHRKQH